MAVNIEILPKTIYWPPELESFGFNPQPEEVSLSIGTAYCRYHNPDMRSVRAFLKEFTEGSISNRSVITNICFDTYSGFSYNADGSLTMTPKTIKFGGEEILASFIEINYSYPIAIMNPVD